MLLFDTYTRADVAKYRTIYLTQEPVVNRQPVRFRCLPPQNGQQVLVDAISEEHARAFYEREFHQRVSALVPV